MTQLAGISEQALENTDKDPQIDAMPTDLELQEEVEQEVNRLKEEAIACLDKVKEKTEHAEEVLIKEGIDRIESVTHNVAKYVRENIKLTFINKILEAKIAALNKQNNDRYRQTQECSSGPCQNRSTSERTRESNAQIPIKEHGDQQIVTSQQFLEADNTNPPQRFSNASSDIDLSKMTMNSPAQSVIKSNDNSHQVDTSIVNNREGNILGGGGSATTHAGTSRKRTRQWRPDVLPPVSNIRRSNTDDDMRTEAEVWASFKEKQIQPDGSSKRVNGRTKFDYLV